MTLSDKLSTALAVRLNLQIGVSALPVVDEAMDAPLGRWIDSAPLPPESADGNDALFEVRLATDFSRVTFSMHGLPGGVIPKLGPYLRQSGLLPAEEALIDELGGALEPPRVGSFIAIEAKRATTGWLFPSHLRLDALAEHVPGLRGSAVHAWLSERGVPTVAGMWQAIADRREVDLWVAPPGSSPESAVASAAELFEAVGGGSLPATVRRAALGGEPPRVVVRLDGPKRVRLAVVGAGRDAVRAIAAEIGAAIDPGLDGLVTTLGAGDIEGLEYAVGDGAPELSVVIAPSGAERRSPDSDTN